tara:strand:+ start:12611 stop:12820 length:210 start_codon:yes stop_codon:yes gene_type:complete
MANNITIQMPSKPLKTNVTASTPAEIAETEDFSLENVKIVVGSDTVSPNYNLRDNDFVAFSTSKVTSGA